MAPRPAAEIRAGLYGRISLARFGETIKTDTQLDLCAKLAQQRDWPVYKRYADSNKSAWQRNRKRAGWDRMLADVETGEINAIVVYHGDRLIRQPWDLEILINLADQRGIRLASPTGDRNLDNPDDRYILRIEAAGHCRESDNTSRRLKFHYAQAAERGVVRLGGRGGRAFGFEPDGLTVRADDAVWIREIAKRILAGESIGAIARDVSARGCRTTAGNVWDHSSLRKLMARARLAGLVDHNGEIVGQAAWPAILERGQWETVCAVLDRKATGFAYATNARKYLLTGLAKCGPCGEPLTIRHNTREESLRGYGCINPSCQRKVHRSLRHLDEFVIGFVIDILGRADIKKRMSPKNSGDLSTKLVELLATRDRRIEEFADDEEMGADVLRIAVRRLDRQIADVRTQLAQAEAPHVLDDVWGITEAQWSGLQLQRQRAVVAAVADIRVLPSRRGPGFDPSTVQVTSNLAA